MIRRRPLAVVSRKRAALFGLVLAILTVPLVVPVVPSSNRLAEGDRAPRTLEALRDAQYESSPATDIARQAAADAVTVVPLPLDPAIKQQQIDRQTRLLDAIRVIRSRTENLQQRLDLVAALPAASELSNAGRSALLALDRDRFDLVQQRATRTLTEILSRPDARPDAAAARVEDYLGRLPARVSIALLIDPAADDPAGEATALRETLRLFVVANDIDKDATQRNRDAARANISPIVKSYTRGQVIAGEGDRLNAEAIEALEATGVIDQGFDPFEFAGGGLFALGFGLLLAVFTYLHQPFTAPVTRRMVLVGLAVVASLAAVRVAIPLVTPDAERYYFEYALPVAAVAMVAAAFADLAFGAVLAVGAGLLASFIAATAPDLAGSSFVGSLESLELASAWVAAGLAGAVAVHRAERLSRYALAGVASALAGGGVMVAFWLIGLPRENVDLGWIALAATLGGFGSAVVALSAFVLVSPLLGVTTRLQLMELAQPEHPLLRRLQDEAPGTYHHSVTVGALAERGAARIGADALLARVGSYYHDIGKLARPGHYIENMLDGLPNPHDGLAPEVSAAIIRDHVTAGLEIARKYRIPPPIRDFIPEHHGTRLVTYFYRRAVRAGTPVDPVRFRYTGPRPQSKESAIVMLADSCEAVVRARQDSSDPALEDLVDGVFAERLAEGQLDNCDITMRELQQVAASFKATLRAIYHPRLAYPEPTPEELAGLARGDAIPARSPSRT